MTFDPVELVRPDEFPSPDGKTCVDVALGSMVVRLPPLSTETTGRADDVAGAEVIVAEVV